MNLFLIGYRCAGKTSVGRRLAGEFDWPFVDTDERIVRRAGSSIARMVADQGWHAFRRMERLVMRDICLADRQVIATGGGAVLDPDNVASMKASGRVVWLRVGAETVRRRMIEDVRTAQFRPALNGDSPVDEIEATLKLREPYYRHAMDFMVEADELSLAAVCELITKHLAGILKHDA